MPLSKKQREYLYSERNIAKLEKMQLKNHSETTKKKMSELRRGEKHPLYGKHHKKESKNKMSESMKELYRNGFVSPAKGKSRSEETKKKISEAKKGKHIWKNKKHPMFGKKGKLHPMFGKKASKEWVESNRKGHLGKKLPEAQKKKMSLASKKLWENPEYREKCIKAIFKSLKIKPNKPEKFLNNLLQQNFPNKFEYTGDGKIFIRGFCPDFIYNKKIIELDGDYWHNLPNIKEKDKRKLETYKKYGYDTLSIWEHELKNSNKIIKNIKEFMEVK